MTFSFGNSLRMTLFGESHGKGVGIVVEGVPAGLELSESDLQAELDKRKPGKTLLATQRKEEDAVEILSGIFNGRTTGAPIACWVKNKDVVSTSYEEIKDIPRPGHADFPARVKFGGFNDYRGGWIFSARLTIGIVAAGAIAKKLLEEKGIRVASQVCQIGRVKARESSDTDILGIPADAIVKCADAQARRLMEEEIEEARRGLDSLGGVVECRVLGEIPVGLGEPWFDSVESVLAHLLFSIPAVKGVEFGSGFGAVLKKGSENNDEYAVEEGSKKIVTKTNNAGGILGGLTNGMPVVFRVAIKPPSSIAKNQKTVNLREIREADLVVKGRHDPCTAVRAPVIVECAAAFCLADFMLEAQEIPRVLERKKGGV